MLNRRGMSLVELLISIVVLAIVGAATTKIISVMLSTSASQIKIANSIGEARNGTILLPQELREVGFDTNTTTTSASTDLLSIAAHRITFRAMRGLGITCGTPTLTEFRILKPIIGQRLPVDTDEFLLFVESDPNAGFDDQWLPMLVTAIDLNSTCNGSDPAIAFSLSAAPLVSSSSATAMAISQHLVGGPVRWFERVEYGPFIDGTTGQTFVGIRSLSRSEGALSPIIGPIPDSLSFTLTYFSAAGTVLDPTVANRIRVRSIGVEVTTVTDSRVSLAGTTTRSVSQFPMSTRVALRNTLRP